MCAREALSVCFFGLLAYWFSMLFEFWCCFVWDSRDFTDVLMPLWLCNKIHHLPKYLRNVSAAAAASMCVYVRTRGPSGLKGWFGGYVSMYVRVYVRGSAQNMSTYMVL